MPTQEYIFSHKTFGKIQNWNYATHDEKHLSSTFSLLLRNVFRYRLDTVRKNLKLVFPEKSSNEIIKIEKDFYKHF